MSIEKIKHAAVKSVNGHILLGKCHADCCLKGFEIGLKISSSLSARGFFTNKGRFVSRKRAAEIAKHAKQIKPKSGRKVKFLLSEDIWYWEKIIYCPIRGYLKVST